LYVFVLTLINPKAGPPLPPEARTLGAGVTSLFVMIGLSALVGVGATMLFTPHVEQAPHVYGASVAVIFALAVAIANKRFKLKVLSYLAERVIMVLVPPLALIFLVLGTIFIGLATPTEGGAMGAVGALVLAAMNGRLTFTLTKQACESTLKLSAFVMFILIGARVFALTFYGINGHVWVKELMLSLPGGAVGFIIFTNFVVFILGCFIDFFEIAFILMPLLVAPAEALKIDIVWFGVLMAMNMQTSFLTPPFGFALFYLRSVAPRLNYTDKVTGKLIEGVQTTTLYRGVIPFILLQVFMVVVVYFWPQLVLHYKDAIVAVDPADVQRQLDNLIIPGLGGPGADEPPPLRF
jgi:tripartite ATP-independent transporter DctM subunit